MSEFLRFLLLGIIQGLTEPLPISSSGHMTMTQTFLDIPNQDYFLEVWLHFASLIAILIIFRTRVKTLIVGNYQYFIKRNKAHKRTVYDTLLILIGIIPVVLFGLLFTTFFEGFLNLLAVGLSLFVTGTFLLSVQKRSLENTRTNLNVIDALTIGFVQVIALLPGISRSGSTMVGGLYKKLKFEAVLEYSFMLYIPISVGMMLYELYQVESFTNHAPASLAASFVASLLMTYLAFKWFVHLVKQGNLKYFGFYCYVAGSIAIVFYLL